MTGKPIDYVWAFLIGGVLSAVAQGVFQLLLPVVGDFSWTITWMLAVMAALSGVLTAFGQYQKLENRAGFGAMLPFTGFSAAIIEFTAAALDEGAAFWPAARKGLHAAFIIFGVGLPLALAAAFVVSLR